MAYTYDPHSWSTKEAITKSKMQHIEDGIKGAADQANANETALNNLQTASSAEDVALWNALGYSKEILKNTTIQQAIQNLQDQIGDSNMKQDLAALKTEVENAREQGYADLRATLQHIRDNVNSVTTVANRADGTASALETAINNARGTYATLKDRIDAIVSANDEAHRGFSTDITTIANTLSAPVDGSAKSAKELFTQIVQANRDTTDTLDKRFDAIDDALGNITGDTANTIATRLNNVITEVEAARASATNGNITYTNLDARLEADETNIKNTKDEVNAAHRATVDNDTLNNRFNDIEAVIDHVQGENDEIPNGLKQRITAAESAIDTLEDTTIPGLETRLDAIDTTNGTLAQHINTVESNISTIQNQISHAVAENDAGGLTERITAAESDIDTIEASIGGNFDNINTVAAAINAKVNSSDMETALAAKANSSEVNAALATKADATTVNAISTTIVKAKADVAYTEGIPSTTQTWTINDKDDYLLQAADDKYYYWKHIANEWHLMGGAGNGEGGGGNTSGMDLTEAQYATIVNEKTYTENTDYYVSKQDGFVHHYRYVLMVDENTQQNVLTEIEIGTIVNTNNIKTYNITRVDTKRENSETHEEEDVSYLNLYEFDYGVSNSTIDDQSSSIRLRAQIELPRGGGGSSAASSVTRLYRLGDESLERIVGSQIKFQIYYSSYDAEGVQSQTGSYILKRNGVVIDSTELSGSKLSSGAFKETISGWKTDTPGYHEFDVTKYCQIGDNTFTITVDPGDGSLPPSRSLYVNIKDLRLETTAPETLLIDVNEVYLFPYVAYGALDKTLHIIIDNNTAAEKTIPLSSSTSGRDQTYSLSGLTHGAHTIKMYLTARVGGIDQSTVNESIIREYIWYANNVEAGTILASPKHGQTISALQYATIEIPYQIYKSGGDTADVYYYLDDAEEPYEHVVLNNIAQETLSYVASSVGQHTITIAVDDVSMSFTLVIEENTGVDISPITGAIIDFDPIGLSNSSKNKLPSWTVGDNTYHLTASDNFNWSEDTNGGGYKQDADGKCFIIKAGSYVDLDYPMFSDANGGILSTGGEMKIIFKTKAVRDVNAIWYKNIGEYAGKTVGIQLGAHVGWLKTDKASDTEQSSSGTEYDAWVSGQNYNANAIVVYKEIIYKCLASFDDTNTMEVDGEDVKVNIVSPKDASDYWLAMGKVDTQVLATDSYLYFPYSEEDKIELDININKYVAGSNSNFIMSYEDGVPSKAYAYTYGISGDGLIHNNTIRIGSDDCDVYIYRLRIYNKSLQTNEILQNFIADGQTVADKVKRYNRNSVYWDANLKRYFTSPSPTAILDPIKLAEKMPDVKILMLDTPMFTTGKKNFIPNTTLRCLQASGGTTQYASRGDADNWFFENGLHSGQGTTSDNYGQSARNVDFLFICDGKHWPSKEKNVKKTFKLADNPDYKSTVAIGQNASVWNEETETWESVTIDEETGICKDWKGDECKVSLTKTSIPNNYFNLKENVASSENVNNALFQKRYNDFLVYHSPAKERDSRIKNSMEFVPALLFVRENDTTTDGNGNYTKHTEFNDTNWHFYGLGNLGDSKKTDYTRAYDPTDMNEFTVENSDNNTNNGQFQSGVFMYNGQRMVETDYSDWANNVAYKTDNIVIYDNKIYKRIGADQAELEEGDNPYTWVAADWQNVTPQGKDINNADIKYAPRYNPNPMDYLYPISSDEWNLKVDGEYLNRKHATLVNEEFDGDHSFEFRYACRGDYRDGDLVNDTSEGIGEYDEDGKEITEDKVQFDLNHDVVLAFYEWLLTSTEEQYRAEASEWIVKDAMEFFYAYTHYYTMMDNRAKNTFWHFAKTGEYRRVSRPVEALYHVYKVADDNSGTFVKPSQPFDANETYYTEYAFDLWAYDMDTAAGIDNNGAQVFPYGKEDDDYRVKGVSSSGYAFNGAGSIFWRRLKTTFADEIREVMNSTDVDCFNSEDLINEFDTFQNCFPEEIWRLDIERKYIRTFTGASVDNSITTGKQNSRFLTSMMQGRKKYQRRQWIRNQGVYFNSKYRLTDIIRNENTIEFNIITPSNKESLSVTPDYHLQLTPYQDMYLNVQVGNGNYQDQIRAEAGKTYTIDLAKNTSGTFQETRIYINGFNSISGIGNLAPMYPYSFTLSALNHLKVLDIGTNDTGYVNANLTSLPLTEKSYLPLLEKLNVKNCASLSGSLGLNTANNIREVEATGTSIAGVVLPAYTNIETLHLPTTTTAVELYGARKLKDFKISTVTGTQDYSSLYTLDVYDSDYSSLYKENPDDPIPVDWLAIATAMTSRNDSTVSISLLKLSSATIGNMTELDPLYTAKSTVKKLELSGTINVTGNWSTIEKDTYESAWNHHLTFDVSSGTQVNKTKVIYKTRGYQSDSEWVPEQEITTRYVTAGDPIVDIYAGLAINELPQRNPTIAEVYQFGSINQNTYIAYSGWTTNKNGSNPQSLYTQGYNSNNPYRATANVQEVVLYTLFNSTPHKYTVNWYLEEGKLVKSESDQDCYQGYELEAPTVDDVRKLYGSDTVKVQFNADDTVTYSIFNGWEKLPTNISPTLAESNTSVYNIYGKWYTNTVNIDPNANDNFFADTSAPTLEQLLVLSRMNSTDRNNHPDSKTITVNKKLNYQMGFNGTNENSGTIIVNTNSIQSFNSFNAGNGISFNNITPFSTNDGFTLALDYQFDSTQTVSTSAAVLVGCYDKVNGSVVGFALYNNTSSNYGPTGAVVGYGNMFSIEDNTKSVGILGQREMLVIRHPANSAELWIYSSRSPNSSSLSENLNIQHITLNTQTLSSNAVLCLGHLRSDITTNSDFSTNEGINTVGAQGTIYWAKYWNEDLGAGECQQLAQWPHENMTVMIGAIDENQTQEVNSNTRPAIYLTGLNSSSHGLILQERFGTNDGTNEGWDTSIAKQICDARVFNGLPIKMQSILSNIRIGHYNYTAQYNNTTYSTVYALTGNLQTSLGYIYLPSVSSLDSTKTTYNNESIYERNGKTNGTLLYDITPYNWYDDSSSMVVYDYYSTGERWRETAANGQYYNIRFNNKPISWSTSSKMHIYRIARSAINSGTTLRSLIGASNLVSGDIVILTDEAAYMYVSTNDLNQGLQAEPQTGIFDTTIGSVTEGGWIRSHSYLTRSPSASSGSYNNFIYVNALGSTIIPDNSNVQPGLVNLDYAFTI